MGHMEPDSASSRKKERRKTSKNFLSGNNDDILSREMPVVIEDDRPYEGDITVEMIDKKRQKIINLEMNELKYQKQMAKKKKKGTGALTDDNFGQQE